MRLERWLVAVLLVATPLLAGCATPAGDAQDPREGAGAAFPACEHPWPCADGSEWPADLVAPEGGFALAERLRLSVPMEDGVLLDGAVWLPEVPEGMRLPVVLWVTPYAGQCRDDPSCSDAPADSEEREEDFEFLWANGYAAALFSLRGTGLSGGCFDYYGAPSQRDMATLVDWLAAQEWTNGRVGMWGISAMGTTPWMAAVGSPAGLKAIAPSGIISDLYLNRFTPQGASDLTSGAFQSQWGTLNSQAPPGGVFTGRPVQEWPAAVPEVVENHPDRLCEETTEWETAALRSQYTDDRRPAFWEERRLAKDFANVTAAVLVQHGFGERGHAFQDDIIWEPLANAPKRMLIGQWPHDLHPDEELAEYPHGTDSRGILLEWFDFWLKGLGSPPRVGVVDYHPDGGEWRNTTAWPPTEARLETLHLVEGRLQPAADASASTTLRAAQADAADVMPSCAAFAGERETGGAVRAFLTEPLAAPVVVAGNPMAFLELESDQEGGLVAVDLLALDASGDCRHFAGHGAADLRFHKGNMQGEPFPTDAAEGVRVDLWSGAVRVAEGERLLVLVSGSGEGTRSGQPQYAPTLTFSGESHVVLPLVEGTLGGAAPTMAYPPRPR